MAVQPLALPGHIFNRALFTSIHDLWFSSLPPNATAPSTEVLKKWFGRGSSAAENEAFDDQCRAVAGPALESLGPEKWPLPPFRSYEIARQEAETIAKPLWDGVYEKTADEQVKSLGKGYVAVGLVLLLDQMTRNIFRDDQSKIYSHYDRISRSLSYCITDPSKASSTLNGLDQQGPEGLSPTRRMWFYMPLEHSESLADHDVMSAGIKQLKHEAITREDQPAQKFLEVFQQSEKSHRDTVEKFGRYPYRNDWLRRDTTKLEKEWLETGGQTFGASAKPQSTIAPPSVKITKLTTSGMGWMTAITSLTVGIGLGFLIATKYGRS